MRTLLTCLALSTLTAGCGTALDAPSANEDAANRRGFQPIPFDNQQVARLARDLAETQAAVASLQAQVDEQKRTIETARLRAKVTEAYALALAAGNGDLAGNGSPDDLRAALFPQVEDDGTPLHGVEGVAHAALLRIRQRPDLLVSEWDELIDEALEQVRENPLSFIGQMSSDVGTLRARGKVVETYTVAMAGGSADLPGNGSPDDLLAAYFPSRDADGSPLVGVGGVVNTLQQRPDILGNAWDALIDVSIDHLVEDPLSTMGKMSTDIADTVEAQALLVEATHHFIDDWQGETAYMRGQVDALTCQACAVSLGKEDEAWVCLDEGLSVGGEDQFCGNTDHF